MLIRALLFYFFFYPIVAEAQSTEYEIHLVDDISIPQKKGIEINTYALYPKSITSDFKVIIFPNPVEDILSVEITSSLENFEYSLYMNDGKFLQSKSNVSKNFKLNMMEYAKGIYILKIMIGSEKKTFKIIKK